MIFEKIHNSIKSAVDAYDALVGKVNSDKPMIAVVMPKQDAISLMNFLGSCEIAKKSEIIDEHAYKIYGKDIENHIKHQIASDLSEFLLDKIFFVNSVDHEKMLIRYDGYMVVGDVSTVYRPSWKENKHEKCE